MSFPPLPPQQQNEIKLSSRPRSGEVKYKWDYGQSDANLMLNAKYQKNRNVGSASLVGEIAQIIAKTIFLQNNSSFIFGGVTFSRNRTDIVVSLGTYSSYASIIKKMQRDGNATKETAEQILKNLSKGYIEPNESGEFNLDVLSDEIFEELDENAKKLMAVLICETIRFNDDGASARMAMRLVISKFEEECETPFEDVFVGNSANGVTPLSIFATTGGKQRMIDQILGHASAYKKDSTFEQDMESLAGNVNFISDVEDGDKDFSVFSLNTSQPSTHQMQTRSKGEHSQGFYEDPPTSTVPSPARPQNKAVKPFGNHDVIHFNLDELSPEEKETNTFKPLGEHFCQHCNLLYWRAYGRSDVPILNECPQCRSSDYVIWIPDEKVARLVIENHINGGGKDYFENDIEGIFVENE